MKILLAVDDSECAMRAVAHVVKRIRDFRVSPEIHLVHVQFTSPGREAVPGYYKEESAKALEPARNALQRAGIEFEEVHLLDRQPGVAIAHYASSGNFSLIVLGSHGQGAVSSLLLGSVAHDVLSNCSNPALMVR